jgi:16S rRNA (guanine527-N7)-methyltransferase
LDTSALPGLPAAIEKRLREGVDALGLAPTVQQIEALVLYLLLLEKWNRSFNLTGLTEPADMVARHILDSLTARPFVTGRVLLDVGSGPGLPGIPLAVIVPELVVTLLDSNGKKARFLRHAVAELGLANATVAQIRVEAYPDGSAFDTVICRALGSLAEFVSGCARLLRPGGRLLAMKGRLPVDEMQAVVAPWRVTANRVTVPGLSVERHIIVMDR